MRVLAFVLAVVSPAVAVHAGETAGWVPWSEAAFARAREAQRPVLAWLDDPTCRACAPARADLAGAAAAEVVLVRVDTLERPEVADLLELAASELGRGRPRPGAVRLLALTPGAVPFDAADVEAEAAPALAVLAAGVGRAFAADRPGVEARAEACRQALQAAQIARSAPGGLTAAPLERWRSRHAPAAPPAEAPAFPAGRLRLLVREHDRGDAVALAEGRRIVEAWLSASADADLLRLPGRETRVGPNALLLEFLLEHYRRTGDLTARARAAELAEWLAAAALDPRGGFRALPASSDPLVLAGESGLALGALALAGSELGRPRLVQAAAGAVEAVLARLGPPERLTRCARGDSLGGPALLEDHAFLAEGLLRLHRATGEPRWRALAATLLETAVTRFGDPAGGFFETHEGHLPLPVRPRNGFDGELPSANGVLALAAIDLAAATGERRHLLLARRTVEAFLGAVEEVPQGLETVLAAASAVLLAEGREVVPGDRGPTAPPAASSVRRGPVAASLALSRTRLAAGGRLEATVSLQLEEGWWVVAANPEARDLTGLALTALGPFRAERAVAETPVATAPVWGREEAVHVHGTASRLRVPLRVEASCPPGRQPLRLRLRFQACTARTCRPAEGVVLEEAVEVVGGAGGGT